MMMHSPKKKNKKTKKTKKVINDNLEDCGESSIFLLRSVLLGRIL